MINPFKPTGLCEVSADFHLKVIMDMDIDFVAFLESTAELVKSFETDKLPFNSLYNLNGEYYGVKYEDDGELSIDISKPATKVSHINEIRGKDYKHLVWCLSQEEITEGLKRKIKRYVLHSL